MTAPLLLFYITAVLLAQVAAGIVFALWRRRARTEAPLETAGRTTARPDPSNMRDFRVVHREYADPARTQCSFHLEPADGRPLTSFLPGQFLTFSLRVPGPSGAALAITRCYSLSDIADPAHYRITVKRIPGGKSSEFLHDRISVGDIVQAKPPAGHFTLDPDPATPVVLIAGGIGITPLFPMLRALLKQSPARAVHLYYGVRRASEGAFRAELEALRVENASLTLHWVYSQPATGDDADLTGIHRGRIDLALLQRTLPHGLHHFYLCGPSSMLNDLVPALRDWGVPASHIHFETFGPSTVNLGVDSAVPPADALAARINVEFRSSGRSLPWDGDATNLLDFAERHSVAVQSGCRSGSCGSCETRLLAGEVRYARPPDHDIAPGYCLLCVGRPSTSVALEA